MLEAAIPQLVKWVAGGSVSSLTPDLRLDEGLSSKASRLAKGEADSRNQALDQLQHGSRPVLV
jgi:hypothetical protein